MDDDSEFGELEDFGFIKILALADDAKVPATDEDAAKMFNSLTWQIYRKLQSSDHVMVWEGLGHILAGGSGDVRGGQWHHNRAGTQPTYKLYCAGKNYKDKDHL